MIQPPSTGPMIGATTTPMPKTAIAMPRLAGGKLSMRIACDKGCSAPPAAPCSTRAKMRKPSVVGHAAGRRGQREHRQCSRSGTACGRRNRSASRSSAARWRWRPDSWSAPRWLRRCWPTDCRQYAAGPRWRPRCRAPPGRSPASPPRQSATDSRWAARLPCRAAKRGLRHEGVTGSLLQKCRWRSGNRWIVSPAETVLARGGRSHGRGGLDRARRS